MTKESETLASLNTKGHRLQVIDGQEVDAPQVSTPGACLVTRALTAVPVVTRGIPWRLLATGVTRLKPPDAPSNRVMS